MAHKKNLSSKEINMFDLLSLTLLNSLLQLVDFCYTLYLLNLMLNYPI